MTKKKKNQRSREPDPAVGRDSEKPITATLPRSVSDRLILDRVDEILPGKCLLLLISGTALAKHLVKERPDVSWQIHTFEHFYVTAVVNALSDDVETEAADIELFCTPDLPNDSFDNVLVATDSRGSSELTRELLQAVTERLKPDGRLIISTNNAKDHWLHEQLKAAYGKTTVHRDRKGICYVARRATKPKKLKSYDCEFAFRDGERLIRCFSRPGVFSHRRVDGGARALCKSLDLLPTQNVPTPNRIVEIGCGSGAVATAAALRYPKSQVLAVDSHVRAIQSTEQTAALNDAGNVSVLLTSDGNVSEAGSCDLFLCNPPYYSDYRISELFLESAAESLRAGGRLHLVTKLTEWHENRMIELFANAAVHNFGEYNVVVSRR